jgi:hypothetical protein
MMSEADSVRSSEIADHGYRVVRFWNGDVMENLEGVLQIISDEMKPSPHGKKSREARKVRVDPAERPTSPSPSPMRRVPSLSALGAERANVLDSEEQSLTG